MRASLGAHPDSNRFLLLPWVRAPHLASHLLGQVAACFSTDWPHQSRHPMYLLETFIAAPRFAGTCYRAAGWVEVGRTTGRTRNDHGAGPRAPSKALYLKALRAGVPRRLAS